MNNKRSNRSKKKRLGYSRVRLTVEEMEAFQSFDGVRLFKVSPLAEPRNKDEYPEIGMNESHGEDLKMCAVSFFKAKSGSEGKRTHVAMGSEGDIAFLREVLSDYREGRREVRRRNKKKKNEDDVLAGEKSQDKKESAKREGDKEKGRKQQGPKKEKG